jgi:4,5:9,10-diseco-3-hydroxy-5,9,17-trioxoandrosta-1(10),2-diene-4-oate hydrolase
VDIVMTDDEAASLTKSATDRFVEVNGIRLHYNEAGSGPTLICTHGGGPGANAWDNTKHAFAALSQRLRVILLDCPGYGESQMGVSRNGVPMDVFVAGLLRDFMDTLQIERAHLYGSAQFGAAALRFGIDYPDRTGKIIVQSAGIGGVRGGERSEGLKAMSVFADHPTRETMTALAPYFTPREELRGPDFIETRLRAALVPGHLESRKEMSNASNSDLVPDLERLRSEVLLLWGNEDRVIHADRVLRALEVIPNSRAVIWGDRSGHFVIAEHSDEFARIVVDFLTH